MSDALSKTIILKFCELCQWTHNVWAIYKELEELHGLKGSRCPYVLTDLSMIIQEYLLLQIAKLHDPAVQKDKNNLTIDYVIGFGGWDNETLSKLREIKTTLEELKVKILGARNKILCHNDLETILNVTVLGEFDKDADKKYFEDLQKFVDIIHDKAVGVPYILMANNDAKILVDIIMGEIKPLHDS